VTENNWMKVLPKENSTFPPKLNSPNIEYYEDCLYVVTGDVTSADSREEKEFQSFFKYCLNENEWKEITPSNAYQYRYYSKTAVIESHLYVLFGWSDSTYDDISEISYFDLTDEESIWQVLNVNNCSALDSYSATVVNNQIYFFGGYSASEVAYLNQMFVLNKTSETWTCTQINDNYEVPPARQYHSISAINSELYIFGGQGVNSYLGDMWKLDKNKEWQSVHTLGSVPSSRYGHSVASTGDIIVLWGGFSDSGYQNDLYVFSALNNYWRKIEPDGLLPSGKLGACLVLKLPAIYLFGGKSNGGLSDELWVYDTSNNSYTEIKAEDPPDARYYCECEVLEEKLWVMMGTGASDSPLASIYKFDLVYLNWTLVANADYPPEGRSLGVVKHFNSFILSLGGEAWTTDPMNTVYLIDLETKNFTCVGILPIYFYAGAFALIETTLYLYGGGSFIGDSLRLSVPSLSFNYIDLKQLEKFNDICSPGSYYRTDKKQCETCKAGYYSDTYIEKTCKSCPPGTYNSFDGASSESQCYPCSYGTYSNKSNATYCLQCPVGKICPIGSTIYYDEVDATTVKSEQPENYSPDTEKIKRQQAVVYSVIFGIWFITFVCFLTFPFIQTLAREFDMFYEEHNYKMEADMFIKKNKTGGAFFCGFCFIALLIIGLSWIDFLENNVIEEKTLRPIVVLDELKSTITGTFTVYVDFINYGGDCKNMTNSEYSIVMQSNTVKDSQVSYSKKASKNFCTIELTCSDCELAVGDYISMSLNQADSYCSAISVNITSDSSIPGYKSTMQTYLSSTSYKIFRGYDPSIFYFKMTPSYFKSYADEWRDSTGYHVSVDVNPVQGSEYLISE
jgi:N-acetylneuraminic acid mutarotase